MRAAAQLGTEKGKKSNTESKSPETKGRLDN